MAAKFILHLLSPTPHISPFDANMAVDSGYDVVLPYSQVKREEVTGLVQDAIFSRPPKQALHTGVFIGGKDALLALDMLETARKAMVPPFVISVFADPAGSFTTAAAMVAHAERVLHRQGGELRGRKVAVFGATGVVGFASGVIAVLQGAEVILAGHDGIARVSRGAEEIGRRFGVHPKPADASTDELKVAVLRDADVVFCAGRAGVQVLSAAQLQAAPRLRVAADVNAVPPAGVEGIDVKADGTPIPGTQIAGIGALAIGNTKYQTQARLFREMIEAAKPLHLDFRHAFEVAQEIVKSDKGG
jgi:methylene-tetrahydromethanopterin dehydrogenase